MKILMTQRELVNVGGTEIFTVEVSRELRVRGHEVAIFTPKIGPVAERVYSKGVTVRASLKEIPWVPDLIHGHHHLPCMAALAYFPNTPAVYYCHGTKPWVERPPLHPRILRYMMMCAWMIPRAEHEYGLRPDQVAALPNFINTERFSEVKPVPEKPARALLYGHGGFSKSELETLKFACQKLGMSLEFIGHPYGNSQPRPESFLQEYDLVFAIGKCAIDALGCGCAVIPILPGLAGELVTTQNLDAWVHTNFSPIYFTSSTLIGERWLQEQFDKHCAADVAAVCAKIRSNHSLTLAADHIETLYQQLHQQSKSGEISVQGQANETASYMEKIAAEVDSLWVQAQEYETAKQQITQLTQAFSQVEQQLTQLTQARSQVEQQLKLLKKELEMAKLESRIVASTLKSTFCGKRQWRKVQQMVERTLHRSKQSENNSHS